MKIHNSIENIKNITAFYCIATFLICLLFMIFKKLLKGVVKFILTFIYMCRYKLAYFNENMTEYDPLSQKIPYSGSLYGSNQLLSLSSKSNILSNGFLPAMKNRKLIESDGVNKSTKTTTEVSEKCLTSKHVVSVESEEAEKFKNSENWRFWMLRGMWEKPSPSANTGSFSVPDKVMLVPSDICDKYQAFDKSEASKGSNKIKKPSLFNGGENFPERNCDFEKSPETNGDESLVSDRTDISKTLQNGDYEKTAHIDGDKRTTPSDGELLISSKVTEKSLLSDKSTSSSDSEINSDYVEMFLKSNGYENTPKIDGYDNATKMLRNSMVTNSSLIPDRDDGRSA